MNSTVVANGQSWLDIALILAGSADMAYEIARENGMEVSDTPPVGSVARYSGAVKDKRVAEYYRRHGISPATI